MADSQILTPRLKRMKVLDGAPPMHRTKKREKNVTFLRSLAPEVCFFLELNEGIKWHLCAEKITIITITATCSSSLATSLGFSFNTTWPQWYQKSIIIQPLKKNWENTQSDTICCCIA